MQDMERVSAAADDGKHALSQDDQEKGCPCFDGVDLGDVLARINACQSSSGLELSHSQLS